MSGGYGITGIGYNPYMNGLGGLGLGMGSSYGSYGDMTMSGMYGLPGMMGFSPMGMMGMYNPTFMKQMTTSYQDIEKEQLKHASAMHNLMLQNETEAVKSKDLAIFRKSLEDAAVNKGITELATMVRKGDSDGVCEQFDKLKLTLYQKYHDELEANRDRLDPSDTVNNMIQELYAQVMSKKDGEPVSFRNDLRKYGETAFDHGFNKAYFGKSDYHKNYTEETENYLFDTRIDNKGGKDRMEKVGEVFGKVAEGAIVGAGAVGAGLGLAGVSAALSSHARNFLGTKYVRDEAGKIVKNAGKKVTACTFSNGLSKAFKASKWLALFAIAGDIAWQMARE